MIPVAALIVTKNEEAALPRCLAALRDFAAVVVVDSGSTDGTEAVTRAAGAQYVSYEWDGRYPKKRQWCLDHWQCNSDWVFFIDADEVATPALVQEIAALFAQGPPPCAGYFVRGRYVVDGVPLRHGLMNNKLVLFNRHGFAYPVVNDLDLPMGEMEGHYQPQPVRADARIGQLNHEVLHYAGDDRAAWIARHERYARWEAGMNKRKAWPADPVPAREFMKHIFRALPVRGAIAFLHAYIIKGGIKNGPAGWRQACDRFIYYRMISRAMRD
ncbi:MAG: glycosyltransferase family 2 protein [Alphaproteobacteria bacterium]|nr:glycosyltransferase family 2 protein [Alphaproteobacteria bacterium]